MAALRGNRCIGIAREVYSKWERRAPLCPVHVKELVKKDIRVVVQPSNRRIFKDAEYEAVGAEISPDLSPASVVFGVKQVPAKDVLPDRTYVFFSHTIKAQQENMALLDTILRKNVRLLDYECIEKDGRRLIAFGKFAGIAGMVTTLRGLGERMLCQGYSTPFLSLGSAYMYPNLNAAKTALTSIGEEIKMNGLPKEMAPFVVVFTGNGNVSQGAQEMFRLLPHKMVSPKDLGNLPPERNVVYGCVVEEEDMVRKIDGAPTFERSEYYAHPENFEGVFHKNILPHASAIVNAMYWDQRYPRLITTEHIEGAFQAGTPKLIGVGDISCDIGGSIEFLVKDTSVEKPFFLYDVGKRIASDSLDGEGVLMMGVDILPSELPRESSHFFGDKLLPFVEALATSDGTLAHEESDLPPELRDACITHHGQLTPGYAYIEKMRQEKARSKAHLNALADGSTAVLLTGHLFDSGLINQAFNTIEEANGAFCIIESQVMPNVKTSKRKSSCIVQVTVKGGREALDKLLERLKVLATVYPAADATVQEMPASFSSGNFMKTVEHFSSRKD